MNRYHILDKGEVILPTDRFIDLEATSICSASIGSKSGEIKGHLVLRDSYTSHAPTLASLAKSINLCERIAYEGDHKLGAWTVWGTGNSIIATAKCAKCACQIRALPLNAITKKQFIADNDWRLSCPK